MKSLTLQGLAFAVAATAFAREDVNWFQQAVRTSDQMQVFEGLPHPVSEQRAFSAEQQRLPTFRIGGDHFYTEPLKVPPAVLDDLENRFRQGRVFVPPGSSPKTLCGFHADYAVTWSAKGKPTVSALLCFGCGELALIRPEQSALTAFQKGARQEIAKILEPLRQNRPPAKTERPLPGNPSTSPEEVRKLPEDAPLPGVEKDPPPSPDVDLPSDVAEKAVKESVREPLSEQSTEFWWLEEFLPPKKSQKKRQP
jgi:hypothetical protein